MFNQKKLTSPLEYEPKHSGKSVYALHVIQQHAIQGCALTERYN